MGRPLKGREHMQYRSLTESISGHRTQLKDTTIPEVHAWLVARRMICEDAVRAIANAYSKVRTGQLRGQLHALKRRVSCIESLISELCDPISRVYWEAATSESSVVLGVDIDRPMPERDDLFDIVAKHFNNGMVDNEPEPT